MKIYTQASLRKFLIVMSIILGVFSILGAIFIDVTMLILLVISLFFFGLSFLFNINKIHLNENSIKMDLALIKKEIELKDIKQIVIYGGDKPFFLIINLSNEIDYNGLSYIQYVNTAKKLNYECHYINIQSLMKKDSMLLLSYLEEKNLLK